MIKEIDLRKGNSVAQGRIVELRVNAARLSYMRKDTGNEHYSLVDYGDLDGVVITPEILAGFGFAYHLSKGVVSYDEEKDRDDDTHYWEMRIDRNQITDGGPFNLVKWGENQECFTFSVNRLRIRVKYVHELQNLFYSISGKDLRTTA